MPQDPRKKSIPGAAPDCRRRPNPKQSVRKKVWWKITKEKLDRYERLVKLGLDRLA